MKILIIDDQLRSQMQIYLALRRKHHVEVATNADEVIELLDKNQADVVLLDLDYPAKLKGEKNIHLAEQVLSKNPRLRLIGIHNGDTTKLAKIADESGFHDFITRPIKNRQLVQIVNN